MSLLRYCSEQIVWQEVPGEVSLAYTMTGCPVGCKGCHSADTWKEENGEVLTESYFDLRLNNYKGLITCVLFMGGEWRPDALKSLLSMARRYGLNTCLYTGLDEVTPDIQELLTYLKAGPWIAERGGLESLTTNQRFIDLRSNEILNYRFQEVNNKQGENQHVKA